MSLWFDPKLLESSFGVRMAVILFSRIFEGAMTDGMSLEHLIFGVEMEDFS